MSKHEKFYEGTVYQTSTGRSTSPVPCFNGTIANNTRVFHSWLISESIAEAEHRNDWFNKIWLEELQRRVEKSHKEGTVTTAEKYALGEYMSNPEWVFEMPYKMTREILNESS